MMIKLDEFKKAKAVLMLKLAEKRKRWLAQRAEECKIEETARENRDLIMASKLPVPRIKLTPEERIERRKASTKRWVTENREKCRAAAKKWVKEHPERNRARVKAWLLKHPEYRKKQYLLTRKWILNKKYGLTPEQVNKMLKLQGSKCKICGNILRPEHGTHIDHSHETRKIRGLLCFNCNRSLGGFHDNPLLLKRAKVYLEKSGNVRFGPVLVFKKRGVNHGAV